MAASAASTASTTTSSTQRYRIKKRPASEVATGEAEKPRKNIPTTYGHHSRFLIREKEDCRCAKWLSMHELNELRSWASDMGIHPARMRHWDEDIAIQYFHSGGTRLPTHWQPACLSSDEHLDDCIRDEVLRALREASTFEMRDGEVAFTADSCDNRAAFKLLEPLGECSDAQCACNRLAVPGVREAFVEMVVEHAVQGLSGDGQQQLLPPPQQHDTDSGMQQLPPPPPQHDHHARAIRYVTLGCGQLLTDAQILAALVRRGLRIERIIAVDAQFHETCRDPLAAGDDAPPAPPRAKTHDTSSASCKATRALASLSRAFRVPAYAFCGASALIDAAHRHPSDFGRCDLFVQCDATAIVYEATQLAAAAALRPDGLGFVLHNRGVEGAATDAWRRTAAGDAEAAEARDAEAWLDAAIEPLPGKGNGPLTPRGKKS